MFYNGKSAKGHLVKIIADGSKERSKELILLQNIIVQNVLSNWTMDQIQRRFENVFERERFTGQ